VRQSDPPWLSPSLRMLINDRDRAFRLRHWGKYRRLREEVITSFRQMKSKYLKMSVSSGNARNVWKAIKSVSRCHSTRPSPSSKLTADDFSLYFSSVFQNSDLSTLADFSNTVSDPPKHVFSVSDIEFELRRLRNKSSGSDELPPWIFRDFSFIFSTALTFIFNESISSGVMPSSFKIADVVPIPKTKNPSGVVDYRPISLLPVLSKVFEKLICRKLILPCIKPHLKAGQFAYIPGMNSGTTTALTLTSLNVLKFLDSSSGAVRILTIDFSRAFDKARHDVILSTAKSFHLSNFLLKWISSYLSNRFQRVRWQDRLSEWSPIRSGVPQGSVLGPVLFCLLVDNFQSVSPNSTVIKYADDITLLHFVRSEDEDNLQKEWDNCVLWSESNYLPLNVSKCKVLDIVTKKSLKLSCVSCSGSFSLPIVDNLKILGVTFSSNLKWNTHLNDVIRKASQRIFILRNLKRSSCPPKLIFNSYVVFIRSVLLYAFPCFCNIPSYLRKKMTSIEKRAQKIINDDDVRKEPFIFDVADDMCQSFFEKVVMNVNHPLRAVFTESTTSSRAPCSIRPPFAKSKRFYNSFIKYSRCK